MGQIYKADFQVDNGTDFDKYNFSTTADQVSYTKNGKETNVQAELDAVNTGIAKLSGKTSTFLDWYGITVGIYRYGRMGSIASISGTLATDLKAYTKYTIGTIASGFRPLNQLTKVILIQGDVQAMLNITREGVVELTPYAALAKGYVPLISEMYEIA